MLDCCILFARHRDDETTRRHLAVLRARNRYPVVAVCAGSAGRVEGALDVGRLSDEGAGEDPWQGADTMLYQ
jgi:hypothetical protein